MLSLKQKGASKRTLLRVETLEERVNPVIFTVTNANDTGAGSLRDAINQANQTLATDDVVFAPGLGTIFLNSTIGIIANLNITGNGITNTVVNGQGVVQIFTISPATFGNSGNTVSSQPNVNISNLRLTGGVSTGNASPGGAINISGGVNTNVAIDDCLFDLNVTVNRSGGAISCDGTLTITDTTFFNNSATNDLTGGVTANGGAISFVGAGQTFTIERSTFDTNTAAADFGGAIAISANNGISSIRNSTFSGNQARAGGAIASLNGSGLIRVANSTIAFNNVNAITSQTSTLRGGGILIRIPAGGTAPGVQLDSTIVSNNTDLVPGTNSPNTDLSGTFATASSFNFIGTSRDLGGIVNITNGNQVGGIGVAAIDPLLLPLANNGGPTNTFLLGDTSAARTTGSNPLGLTTDQRGMGFPRVINGTADIGATQNTPPPILPPPPPPPDPNAPPTPPVALNPPERFAVGSGPGAVSSILVYNSASVLLASLNPFPGFAGGVRVATGDINGDGTEDIVAAAGPGGGPAVVVYDGLTFNELRRFFAYADTFDGGVYVAVGTISRTGTSDVSKDIITGAGAGGGPHVRAFDGLTGAVVSSYFATTATSTFGVSLATTDLDLDGIDEIVTANATGGSPVVRIQDGRSGRSRLEFLAYDPGYTGGVSIAAGDLNGDGLKDIITGSASGASHVKGFNLLTGRTLVSFFSYSSNFTGGVQVASVNIDGSLLNQILTISGTGSSGHLRLVDMSLNEITSIGTFDPGFLGGAFVG